MEIKHKRVRESTKLLYWDKIKMLKEVPKEITKTKWEKLAKIIWNRTKFWDAVIANKLNLVKILPDLIKLLEGKEDEK